MKELRFGVLGLSEGNGHPFSFSAIMNGFSDRDFADAGWPVIHDYLRRRDPADFGIPGTRVTHVWTQDAAISAKISKASKVGTVVERREEMLGQVDAILIARDDPETHFEMAEPFLKAGLPVFIDKPLTLDLAELRWFAPYLRSGQLMSCAAGRYAMELDSLRTGLAGYGPLKLIRGAIVSSWDRYAIHLLDAIYSVKSFVPDEIIPLSASHPSVAFTTQEKCLIQIDALGKVPKTLKLDVWGELQCSSHDLYDNFTMFRRMLSGFVHLIRTGVNPIPTDDILTTLKLASGGKKALETGRTIRYRDLDVV